MGEVAWASGPRLKFLEDAGQEGHVIFRTHAGRPMLLLGRGPGGPRYFGSRARRPELLWDTGQEARATLL